MSEQLKCVILGSFRFKPEIDQAIVEFEVNGVDVLAPVKGAVIKEVKHKESEKFGLLPGEENKDPREVEREFLEKIRQADFVYIVCPGGYAGQTVSGEMGWTQGYGYKHEKYIPIYSSEPLDETLEDHPLWIAMAKIIKAYPINQLVDKIHHGNLYEENYFWCRPYEPQF